MGSLKPKISIIIPTYNRADYVVDTVRSLIENDISPRLYEIIIVDNNSTDHSREAIDTFVKDHPAYNIRCIIEQHQGASFARNRGIKEAEASLLLFVDDDEIADKRLVQVWLSFFENHPNALGGGGSITVKFEDPRPAWMSHFLMPLLGKHNLSSSIQKYPSSKFPFAGNMAYRKQVFEQYGHLKTNLGRSGTELLAGEEKEFYHRLRQHTDQIYHVPEATIYHRVDAKRMTKAFIKKQAIGLGKSMALQLDESPNRLKFKKLASEVGKLWVTVLLCIGYSIAFQFSKADMLLKFRWWIWRGYRMVKNP